VPFDFFNAFDPSSSPALVLALALAAGIVCQVLARHLRIPGIVLLLAAGVLLGPEMLGIIDPSALGHGMHDVVGFAVAVILFEGGLNVNVGRLRREALPIRRLLTFGAGVTLVGGALAARWTLGWSWSLSVLFGTLVIVTGPTVITPLLRRIRVDRTLETILEAEGVFIDAIGAILAIVALEVVTQGVTGAAVAQGLMGPPLRLAAGAILGLAGGGVLTLLLRPRHLVPEGMQNIFSLAWAVALFHVSSALVPETGIAAVIAAGLVVGNTTAAPPLRELKEFKEQLTVLLIGLLFVLLAADVATADVAGLGWGGVVVVAVLMFLIRPLSVAVSTWGSELSWRQRAFLAWVAPRGIVAAAISSLFADRLAEVGLPGGDALRALVFLVIAGTVVLQGASASLLARVLGVRRPSDRGYAVLGGHSLARLFALRLQEAGEEVVILEANQDRTRKAQAQGLRVVFGNAMEERAMLAAQMESRRGIVGLLANSAQNLLFAQKGREDGGAPRAWVALQRGPGMPEPGAVDAMGAHVLFAGPHDIELWAVRVRRGLTRLEVWEWRKIRGTATPVGGPPTARVVAGPNVGAGSGDPAAIPLQVPKEGRNQLLPLLHRRGDRHQLVDETTRIEKGDRVEWLILAEAEETAHQRLEELGWTMVEEVRTPDRESE